MQLSSSWRYLILNCAAAVISSDAPVQAQTGGQSSGAEVEPRMVRLVTEAEFHAERGRLNLAIEKYEQALEAGAGSAAVLNRLAELYMAAGEFSEAIKMLRRSLSEKPGQLLVYSRLGEVFLALGRPDSAIACVEEARDLSPGASQIRSSLGFLYLQSGLPERAKAELDTALALNGRNPEAHRFMGLYYTQLESLATAIHHYERILEIDSNDIEAHNNIAFLHSALRDYDEAMEYYRRTKKLTADPNLLHAVNLSMDAIWAILNGKMRARYILMDSESEGKGILRRLEQGEEFGSLAARFSKAPNARDGGDLGFFGPGDMLPQVEEAVMKLNVDEVSDLILLDQGVMIIQRLN